MPLKIPFRRHPDYILGYICIVVTLIQFAILKYWYPWPSFCMDSYNYLDSAAQSLNVNVWPIGYAKLISFVGLFTHSDTALIFVQYFFYVGSALYFFYTILPLVSFAKWIKYVLFIILFLNPAMPLISNNILSDSFFIGLSLLWIAQLIRLYNGAQSLLLLFTHSLVLLMTFSVRYQAMFYPLISIIIIVLCTMPVWKKWAGIAMIVVLISGFVIFTVNETGKDYTVKQFSSFAGWQMASNALLAYSYVTDRKKVPIPDKFKPLHTEVNHYMDSLHQQSSYLKRRYFTTSAFFLWDIGSPLQTYSFKIRNSRTQAKRMAAVGPLYNQYGLFLIQQYPWQFASRYVLKNMRQYFFPPAENFVEYNSGKHTVRTVAQKWFQYDSRTIDKRYDITGIKLFTFYFPLFIVLTAILFTLGCIGYFAFGWKRLASPQFTRALKIAILFWIFHFAFSVLASPIVLRYQLFNLILGLSFALPLTALFLAKNERPTS
ncbi:hypothetical protein [Chitinophaga filiformis]|uniref:Dolichyl-phosphate-mannose-protein mannosyltransferase n=1 Tax=Chitinophaga filiformis TaxID=104663 RepID=A0A1G7UPF3_CHIFI|nr:hypothetical protein [Chitinophaga filiformis]SDG49111.1 hypothetical protein SAMN04488121_104450 [Chitinophaga filiformis]